MHHAHTRTEPIVPIVTDSSEMMQINVAADKRDTLSRTHTRASLRTDANKP